jgi:hypothetical protein
MAELLVNGAAEDDFENVHGAVDGIGEVDVPHGETDGLLHGGELADVGCKVLGVQAGPGRHNPAKALVSHGW